VFLRLETAAIEVFIWDKEFLAFFSVEKFISFNFLIWSTEPITWLSWPSVYPFTSDTVFLTVSFINFSASLGIFFTIV
jgi:hypothetical protein